MKILILSDLHNEFGTLEVGQTNCDAVVLAGDTDTGSRGAKWALETFKEIPIIYICGNHEYYGSKMYKIQQQLKELSEGTNLFYLENEELILNNIRFLGCTLWTDFRLYGEEKRELVMLEAQNQVTDYKRIRLGPKESYRKLKPLNTISFHNQSIRFLEEKLQKTFSGPTVIVTHHSPSSRSISGLLKDDLINASYCSNLEWMIEKYEPELWIHGHIHQKSDHMINKTHIVCNPRGYFPNTVQGFQQELVLEI